MCGRCVPGRLRGVAPGEDGLLREADHAVILGPEDERGQQRPQVLGRHVQGHQPRLQAPHHRVNILSNIIVLYNELFSR